jgi:DNA-binding NtrC family response regulator
VQRAIVTAFPNITAIDLALVMHAIHDALELTRTQAENRALRSQLKRPRVELIGSTPEIQRVRDSIARVGPTEARVLAQVSGIQALTE